MAGGTRSLALIIALAGCATASAAGAVTLKTADGGRVTVLRQRATDAGRPIAMGVLDGLVPAELHYEYLDGRSGRVHEGTVPGSLSGDLQPALAQDPIGGSIYLVYSAVRGSGSDLVFHFWSGQQWSDPRWLTSDAETSADPFIAFDADGEAILAWRGGGRFLLTHLRLSADGVERVHSQADLGSPVLFPVDGDVRLRAGVAHGVADVETRSAYVFLADPHQDQVVVAHVDMGSLDDIWGGGAAPVPVTFKSADAPTSMSVEDRGDLPVAKGASGILVVPYRIEILGSEVYYWFEDARIRVVAFCSGTALPMLTLDRPTTDVHAHFAAFVAARHQLVRTTPATSRGADATARIRR